MKKFLLVYFLTTVIMFIVWFPLYFGTVFAPANEPDAEIYTLAIPYENAKARMESFKKMNRGFLTKEDLENEEDDVVVTDDYYSKDNIAFDLSNIDYEVNCKLDPIKGNPNATNILLLGASSNRRRTGRGINTSYLGKEENKRIKEEFENSVLNNLGVWYYNDLAVVRYIFNNTH